MNVEIGTEAAQFLLWEYINGIFAAVTPFSITVGCSTCVKSRKGEGE